MSHALAPMRPRTLPRRIPTDPVPMPVPARAPQAVQPESRGECMSCRFEYPLRQLRLGLCPPCETRLDQ